MTLNIHLYLLIIMLIITGCASQPDVSATNPKDASVFNAKLGLGYLQKGRLNTAQKKLEKALRQDPNNAHAHHYMAELQRQLKVTDKAQQHYDRALELEPDNSSIANNYGVFLCGIKKYEQSLKFFNKVLNDPLFEDKAGVYENLGLCAQQNGNMHTAEKAFRRALTLNNNLPDSLLGMAKISYDNGYIKPASSYYKRFLAISKHDPESLWVGLLIERKLKHDDIVKAYATMLRVKFPDSEQAHLLDRLEGTKGL